MRILSLLSILCLASCSTLIERSTQEVEIEVIGAETAICHLRTPKLAYKTWAPAKVRIQNSEDDMTVRCLADGNREKTVTLAAELTDATLLNVGNAGAGVVWDHYSGGAYSYPELVVMDFRAIPYKPYDKPIYHNPRVYPPGERGLETYGPGETVLDADDTTPQGYPKKIR